MKRILILAIFALASMASFAVTPEEVITEIKKQWSLNLQGGKLISDIEVDNGSYRYETRHYIEKGSTISTTLNVLMDVNKVLGTDFSLHNISAEFDDGFTFDDIEYHYGNIYVDIYVFYATNDEIENTIVFRVGYLK